MLADRTAIIVTHDILDALTLADRVVVLHDGHVVEQGPPASRAGTTAHPFTAELTGVTLLTGRRTASGLVTDSGVTLIATALEPVETDARVAATLRPAEVRLTPPGRLFGATAGETAGSASVPDNHIPAVVVDLEPRGDLVRVRTDSYAALATPAVVADLALGPGTPVTLTFPATAVSLYRS